jgi:tetratricopeptide (TPR) repeat protein
MRSFLLHAGIGMSILFLLPASPARAQPGPSPVEKWAAQLTGSDDAGFTTLQEIRTTLGERDSPNVISILTQLEKMGHSAPSRYNVRLKLLWAWKLWDMAHHSAKDRIAALCKESLLQCYELNDEPLTSAISWEYGKLMYAMGEIEPAAMYCLNGAELSEKIGLPVDEVKYWALGEILYHTRDYEKSIYYTRASLVNVGTTHPSDVRTTITRLNTVALCWQRMGKYDSAFFYYDKSMAMADTIHSEVWKGIISGNKGQIYFHQHQYDTAKALFEYDCRTSQQDGDWGNAANSLQWLARTNLALGNSRLALSQVTEAMTLLKRNMQINYLQNVFYATADVYRVLGNSDSFYHYSLFYNNLHDSLERSIADSRMEMSRIKLNNQDNVFKIRNLQKEKAANLLLRNYIIAGIILLAIIAILIMNSQRLKMRHRQQLAQEHRKAAEERLQSFTQTLIEKTTLIENLQDQLQHRELTLSQQQLAEELGRQTILTEEDWDKFRALFEKIYPAFFMSLKERAPDITAAEQRMAALTRLYLTTRQMASILGISADSVNKTRQRLRARLKIPVDAKLEEAVASFVGREA